MTVTITSSLRVALVSGTGVTFDAPVVNLISTDDVYDVNSPADTLTDLLSAISSSKLVGSATVNGAVVGNTSVYTVPTGIKFIPTAVVFALTSAVGTGNGPVINVGFTAPDYLDFIDSTRSSFYELLGGAVFAPGSGYAISDTLTLSGGTVESSDFADITITSASLAALNVNAAGTGYAPSDTITLAGGVALTRGVVTIQTVKLVSATINAGGTGYGNTQTFTATVAGGTHSSTAQISVTSDVSGVVDTINSVSQAGSYTVLPTLTANVATGGTGSGLTLDLVFGILTKTITTNGEYTTTATSFTQFSTSGTGTGATFNGATFGLDNYSISDPGTYISVPSNHVATTGGAGTGATFDATWTITEGPFINVATVGQLVEFADFSATATDSGAGYVYMSPGDVLKVRVAFPAELSTYSMKVFVFGFTFS